MPGGILQDTQLYVAGQPVSMFYFGQVTRSARAPTPSKPSTSQHADHRPWFQVNDINGRVAQEWTPPAPHSMTARASTTGARSSPTTPATPGYPF